MDSKQVHDRFENDKFEIVIGKYDWVWDYFPVTGHNEFEINVLIGENKRKNESFKRR